LTLVYEPEALATVERIMPKRPFAPGFRLSALDIGVLLIGAASAILLAFVLPWLSFVVAFVIGHFFLFCNIIRMARPLELIWAGVFVLLAGATAAVEIPGWGITAGASLAMTAILVAMQMRKPSYHGVGWQWINPQLPAWWDSHAAE
jgi:hypothetical protein